MLTANCFTPRMAGLLCKPYKAAISTRALGNMVRSTTYSPTTIFRSKNAMTFLADHQPVVRFILATAFRANFEASLWPAIFLGTRFLGGTCTQTVAPFEHRMAACFSTHTTRGAGRLTFAS